MLQIAIQSHAQSMHEVRTLNYILINFQEQRKIKINEKRKLRKLDSKGSLSTTYQMKTGTQRTKRREKNKAENTDQKKAIIRKKRRNNVAQINHLKANLCAGGEQETTFHYVSIGKTPLTTTTQRKTNMENSIKIK